MKDVIVFLDDNADRAALMYQRMNKFDQSSTFWCKTANEAIDVLREYKDRIYRVYLDHDLGNENNPVHTGSEQSGMEVIRFLEQQDPLDYKDCEFVVHSWNIYAATQMQERLEQKGYKVKKIPFGM